MTGNVGRAFNRRKRYQEDEEYREKRKKCWKENYQKNKRKYLKYAKEYRKTLKEDLNKRCKKCNKLLDYRTKGNYCKKHWKR